MAFGFERSIMQSLIVYDSLYGNTQKIAEAVGGDMDGEVRVVSVGEADLAGLKDINFLVVGSPTHGGRPTQALQKFLQNMPENSLKNIKVAAFDTRVLASEQGFWPRLFVNTIGYAAPKIARNLQSKGGILVVEPEGFIVEGKEGPLKKGELERASEWAKKICKEAQA